MREARRRWAYRTSLSFVRSLAGVFVSRAAGCWSSSSVGGSAVGSNSEEAQLTPVEQSREHLTAHAAGCQTSTGSNGWKGDDDNITDSIGHVLLPFHSSVDRHVHAAAVPRTRTQLALAFLASSHPPRSTERRTARTTTARSLIPHLSP